MGEADAGQAQRAQVGSGLRVFFITAPCASLTGGGMRCMRCRADLGRDTDERPIREAELRPCVMAQRATTGQPGYSTGQMLPFEED
jgi:hypothetical protein